jgi:hemolysin activation/secretion protein
LLAVEAHREPRLSAGWDLELTARVATFDSAGEPGRDPYGSLRGALAWERGALSVGHLITRLDAGFEIGDFPPQERFFLGGRGTLPGHPSREQAGDIFFLARAEASRAVLQPWVTARASAAGGATGELAQAPGVINPVLPVWRDGVRASAGAGVGLLWDVLHLDLMRGLDGGEWELVVSVDRRFRGWL